MNTAAVKPTKPRIRPQRIMLHVFLIGLAALWLLPLAGAVAGPGAGAVVWAIAGPWAIATSVAPTSHRTTGRRCAVMGLFLSVVASG